MLCPLWAVAKHLHAGVCAPATGEHEHPTAASLHTLNEETKLFDFASISTDSAVLHSQQHWPLLTCSFCTWNWKKNLFYLNLNDMLMHSLARLAFLFLFCVRLLSWCHICGSWERKHFWSQWSSLVFISLHMWGLPAFLASFLDRSCRPLLSAPTEH